MKTATTLHTFTMSEGKARLVHQVVDSHMQALKNWMASAVEAGDLERAQKLIAELREYEALYAAFNMTAKLEIAEHTGKPVATMHRVQARPL